MRFYTRTRPEMRRNRSPSGPTSGNWWHLYKAVQNNRADVRYGAGYLSAN